jgi:uncharacterized membrane protein YhaH (DUF805 family)
MDFGFLFTATAGRINRAKWWAGMIIIVIASFILSYILALIIGTVGVVISALVIFYPHYAVGAKRFQDRGKPGTLGLVGPVLGLLYNLLLVAGIISPAEPGGLYYLIGLLMLAVGIWYFVDLGCLKGASGTNEYGTDPLGAAA